MSMAFRGGFSLSAALLLAVCSLMCILWTSPQLQRPSLPTELQSARSTSVTAGTLSARGQSGSARVQSLSQRIKPVPTHAVAGAPELSSIARMTQLEGDLAPSTQNELDIVENNMNYLRDQMDQVADQLTAEHDFMQRVVNAVGNGGANLQIVPGPRGLIGRPGPAGPTGASGRNGRNGIDGSIGPQGPQGPQGVPGKFVRGPRGYVGPVGPQGPRGVIGQDGPRGPQGERGPRGEKGFIGPPGRNGKVQPPSSYSFAGWQFVTVDVDGPMNGPSLLSACAAKGLRTPCDHPAYCDGKCVVVDYTGHLSYNNDGRRPRDLWQGKYFYAANANQGYTLQSVDNSHRWSDPGNEYGQTLCVKRHDLDIKPVKYDGWLFTPFLIKGVVDSPAILATCRAAGLQTPCDHPSWNNGQCVVVNPHGHMSYAAHNSFPRREIAYSYWYAGNANGVLSIQNVPGSHRWATPCDWDGIAFCVKPIPIDVTDSRMFMGWWMVPTRIPDTVNSNNIHRACSDNGMQTVCDHGAWNNGQCVTLGSFHMSYNPHHPQFIPSYLTNKNFYAGSAYNGYAIQNTGGSHRWVTGSETGQTICITKDSPIKYKIVDPPQSAYSFSSCWDGCSSGLTHAKENSDSAWCAQSNDGNQWTTVDLGKVQWVEGILTQGRKGVQQWLTMYNIYTSNDASSWNRQLSGENDQNAFPGNVDNRYNQMSVFQPVKAQYVKVVPVSWNNHICMRWSVLVGTGDELLPASSECQEVGIGSNSGGRKTVYLDKKFECPMKVSKANWLGGDSYDDTFEIMSNKDTIVVTRTDSPGSGWGMNLRVKCCTA